MSRVGYLLVHVNRGICMGTNRRGRLTWSVTDPSYRKAMPCADSEEQIHNTLRSLGVSPEVAARDYYICKVEPDLVNDDDPFISPSRLADIGLGGLLNNLLSLDFVATTSNTTTAEQRREILEALLRWVRRLPAAVRKERDDRRMLLFVCRMLRKGALLLEAGPDGLQVRLAPHLSVLGMEAAGHA